MKKPTVEEMEHYSVPDFLAARVAHEHGYTQQQGEDLVREAKRMLYICTHTKKPIAPSRKVDHAWHEMLMFTKWYRDYCSFLGAFVHHEPTSPKEKTTYKKEVLASDDTLKRKEAPAYTKTKEMYKEIFGESPNPEYWP